MKIGIVGLPNVGKSTLFNALTNTYAADSANFPFCTIEPNIWLVDVVDERVDTLAKMSASEKVVHAAIQFVDIAGLVKGASTWEGLWNKFLANIREVDAIVQVVRHFEDKEVVHVEWAPDPLRDVEIINTELMLADLQTVQSALEWLQRRAKSRDQEVLDTIKTLEHIKQLLEWWTLAYEAHEELSEKERSHLKQYSLLTYKPFVYALNVAEGDLKNADMLISEYKAKLNKPVTVVCATFESEIMELDADEKAEFVEELKWGGDMRIPTLDDLIQLAFREVGLMYYFTTGDKETKAWTIPVGSTAPQAAWAIHTDFERGFIKAEVVNTVDLIAAWSWWKAREAWKLKLEWKEYIVQDGDVIVFRFNV